MPSRPTSLSVRSVFGGDEPGEGAGAGPFTDPRRRLATRGPLFVHADDGSPWPWRGFSSFFLYKLYLEGHDIVDLLREAVNSGANVVRVFGMSRWMDGGETDATQFWPQKYGEDYYTKLPTFVNLAATIGLRVELTVFADASQIMPRQDDQQRHLDRLVEILKHEPSAFLEVANEPHVDRGVDVSLVQPRDPADLLWATGDYDMERRDVNGVADPRPRMPQGRYVTFHGKRTLDGSLIEAAKEPMFYFKGWDDRTIDGGRVRSYAIGTGVPCVHDEPMGASDQPTNRWGDERYTDPEHARLMGAGHALSGAGGTFHSERGCTSAPLSDRELACARAYFAGMAFYPVDIAASPYAHDRTPSHVLAPVPHLGGETYAAGESVSRAKGNQAYALTVLISHGYVPEGQNGWRVVDRFGRDGGIMRLER